MNGDARTLIGSVIAVSSDLSRRTLNELKPIWYQERDRPCQKTMMDNPPVRDRIDHKIALLTYKCINNQAPSYLTKTITLKLQISKTLQMYK